MKSWWLKTASRYDALQPRERWLVAVALLAGIVLLGFTGFIDPALKRGRLAEQNIAAARTQLSGIQGQMAVLNAPDRNPDVVARAELDKLRAQLDALSARLRAMESALVPPERMTGLLEEMVGKRSGLRLISLKTLPVAPVLERGKADGADKSPEPAGEKAAGLYKHGVEIRLEGSYQELTAYLERLEKSGMKLLWGSAVLSAEQHPRVVLTLTVHSLSMDRAWLVV